MIIDLHVHTSHGSGDSDLSPQQLVEEALGRGRLPVYTSEKQRSKQTKAL